MFKLETIKVADPATGELVDIQVPIRVARASVAQEGFTADGRQIMDSKPLAVPAGYHAEPAFMEAVKLYIRGELSRLVPAVGKETFEDADDFDVDDENALPVSPHELDEMQEEAPPARELARQVKRKKEATPAADKVVDSKAQDTAPKT